MRILVADDGRLGDACRAFAQAWGHELELVRDGVGALRRARAWRPDLVVAPVALDRMDGLVLAAALHAGGLGSTPVALVGPADDAYARRRAVELGAVAYLAAPLAAADLARLAARVAGVPAALRPRRARKAA